VRSPTPGSGPHTRDCNSGNSNACEVGFPYRRIYTIWNTRPCMQILFTTHLSRCLSYSRRYGRGTRSPPGNTSGLYIHARRSVRAQRRIDSISTRAYAGGKRNPAPDVQNPWKPEGYKTACVKASGGHHVVIRTRSCHFILHGFCLVSESGEVDKQLHSKMAQMVMSGQTAKASMDGQPWSSGVLGLGLTRHSKP
jgi:hypothetical protein